MGDLYSQCPNINTEKSHLIYMYDGTKVQYMEYNIENNTNDTMYLWIDSDTLLNYDSIPIDKLDLIYFMKYYRRPKCELGLDFLCGERSIIYDTFPPPPVIGCTFLKQIIPGAEFKVISLDESINKRAIHWVSRSFVNKMSVAKLLDPFCYQESYIIIK